jgi:endonuclease/exonuclease/phosphatase family metal-dependent hydrolase
LKTFRPKRLSLAALVCAATVFCSSAAFSFFYPDKTAGDPAALIWDESEVQGFHQLQLLERAQGLKVFWWNTAWGQYNKDGVLDKNIQELIRSDAAPDVLSFGEFKMEIFSDPNTLPLIRQKYPYEVYVPYNNGKSSDGVGVFSRYPFTQRVVANLDWSPTSQTAEQQETYRQNWIKRFPETESWWNRPYLKLDIDYQGRQIGFVAVHMLEPWLEIRQAKGSASVVEQMFLGKNNPLAYQIERLKNEMRADFGTPIRNRPVMLIGDFNSIQGGHFGFDETECYKLLVNGMENVFMREPKSFPAASAPDAHQEPFKTIGGIKIDHAFVAGGLSPVGAAVIPIRGSDHYPIYVIARP